MLSLPDYQTSSPIYESANSTIYRGVRKKDNQPVILKLFKEDYPTSAELSRYQQEYEIIHSLNSASVIKSYNIEKYQNTLVIVLEDFGGESLKYTFANQEPIVITDFLPLAIQISDALEQIHAANIIHKDINPANIVWNRTTDQLKIIDFGIASRLPRENPTLKNPEQLEGTLSYISPEQTGRMNRSLDYRTDLYSLGVTFYELLTGKLPFDAESPLELVHCHIAKTSELVCEINPAVPQVISDIVMKLMAKNVEDRYQSVFGVKVDLEKCLALDKKIFEPKMTNSLFELGQSDFSGKLQIPQKLYGRENEVDALLQAFEQVSQGKTEMILVAGYSGVGKTALVHEVHKPMTLKSGYFAAGKFDQFQKNIPYSAITQAFNELCRYLLTENIETLTNWRAKILDAVGNNGQIIIDVVPDLELVIGKQSAVAKVGPTEAQNRFRLSFLNFIKALCHQNHPLILFIDDLQWVDSASLGLLKSIMFDDEIRHLLIIGAYRDNEVNGSHPFIMMMDEFQKTNIVINTIELANLLPLDINLLLQDSFKCSDQQTQSLTDLIAQKTQGNAFFIHQFLQTLYSDTLLRFDFEQLKWQWDIEKIAAQNITANVVELMANKIGKLPAKTSTVLQKAACIGNQFDLSILAIIYEQEQNETLSVLQPAIVEELIQPLDENYKRLDVGEKAQFKFLHDRVQQAAYALIDDEQKQAVHLQIGRLLLKNTPTNVLEEKIFDIVGQINHSHELLDNQVERFEIAQLNLIAGNKAILATAYQPALRYFDSGRKLLTEKGWHQQYKLMLAFHVKGAETAYLNGDFELMDTLAQTVLEYAQDLLDQVGIYQVKIAAYQAQNQLLKGFNTGLEILKLLGISFPEAPTQADFMSALQETQAILTDKPIKKLIDLFYMTDQQQLAAMQILSSIFSASYQAAPAFMPLLVFKQVTLSVQYGNTPESAFAYANYGLILCAIVSDIENGYQFGQLALKLLDKFNAKKLKARTYVIMNNLVRHWKEHVKESLPPLLEGYQTGLDTGDLEWAAWCIVVHYYHAYLIGKELPTLDREMAQYNETIAKMKQKTPLHWQQTYRQAVLNLLGCASGSPIELIGESYNELEMLPQHLEANDRTMLSHFYLNKIILCYFFGKYAKAVEYAEIAENYLDSAVGLLVMPYFYFYDSLAKLACKLNAGILEKVSANNEKMAHWAKHAPMNYQHKYDLVEAEKARVLGQLLEAESSYEKAIKGAADNEYIQEEALAYELAGKFYLGRGMEKIAQTYLKEAHYRYQKWGAVAKVKDLEERYPQWLVRENIPAMSSMHTRTSTGTIMASTKTRTSSSLWLDLESIMKASQTLSGEIVLNQLLEKMMRIVIENAGAERGFLVLPNENKWVIEAEGAINKEKITTLHSLPVTNHLPEAIISYVARTQENVVLTDARQEGLYTDNPYIKTHDTKSVLCFPIVYQQQLRAILYFENNLTTGAFTSQRLNLLKMLSSQIAISLENAQWVSILDTKVRERTTQLNTKVEELTQTRQELVQSEKMASLGRLVAGFAHELNTPLGVAIGSASGLQRLAKKVNSLMAQEEVDVDDLLSALDSIDKRSVLTLSNLERAANLVTSFKRTAVDQTSDKERLFQVKKLIQDAINILYSHFKQTEIEISIDCPNEIKVKSLPGALEQIFTNLLMNSFIHGFDEGKNSGSINIKAKFAGNNLHLEYSDNGKGIPTENLEKIFEPFFTTHRAHGGSGLGMYICYNLVTTQLQGNITCKSNVGQGVLFKIDYPVSLP